MSQRIAYLPDSFHEVNGVAHTSRQFVAYASRRGLPFLCIRAGKRPQPFEQAGELRTLELPRSPLALPLEQDLHFDPFFFRHIPLIERTLRAFRPDVIHITGPSELGILGAFFAWKLGIPLAASWHTNVHEYAARRIAWLTRRLGSAGRALNNAVEATTLAASARFYRLAKTLYAPNPHLCALLQQKTARPCHLMQRGVETDLFTPARRTRPPGDNRLILGFVGRLSVEKNVALLPIIDAGLRAAGLHPGWLVVGHGSEQATLRRALGPRATYPGVLRGDALASGVPAIVTPHGGPATIVRHRETGFIADDKDFAPAIAHLLADPQTLAAMRAAARAHALTCSWDIVFDRVLAAYPAPQPVSARRVKQLAHKHAIRRQDDLA